MNKKQTAITVPIVAVLLVALAFFVFPATNVVQAQAESQCSTNPPMASISFAQSMGCVASGGYAYTYVTLNSSLISAGTKFTFSPSANDVAIGSGTVPVIVTYKGVNQTASGRGIWLNLNVTSYKDVVSFGQYINSRVAVGGEASLGPSNTVYLHIYPYWVSQDAVKLFLYFGTADTPNPPAPST